MVAAADRLRLSQKPKPCLSNMGNSKNNRSEGSTNQKICFERSAICDNGEPSTWSQTNANKAVNGRDATSAANPVFRFAISVMATITIAETKTLIA